MVCANSVKEILSLLSASRCQKVLCTASREIPGTLASHALVNSSNVKSPKFSAAPSWKKPSGSVTIANKTVCIVSLSSTPPLVPVMQLNASVKVAVASCFQLSRVSSLVFMPRLEKWRTQLPPLPLDSTCICKCANARSELAASTESTSAAVSFSIRFESLRWSISMG